MTAQAQNGKTLSFPLEMRTAIYGHLQDSKQHKTLASIARCSKTSYLEVVPFLYHRLRVPSSSAPRQPHRLIYGLPKIPDAPREMVKGRKKGEWFKYFDLERFKKTTILLNVEPEKRKLILLGMVETLEVMDLQGLRAVAQIVCYYQRPPALGERDHLGVPEPNKVFSSLKSLAIDSRCSRSIVRTSDDQYTRGGRSIYAVIFGHLAAGVSPKSLCIGAPGWTSVHAKRYDFGGNVHANVNAAMSLARFCPLEVITFHRLSGTENTPEIEAHLSSLRVINLHFAGEDAIDRFARASNYHLGVRTERMALLKPVIETAFHTWNLNVRGWADTNITIQVFSDKSFPDVQPGWFVDPTASQAIRNIIERRVTFFTSMDGLECGCRR